MTCRNDFVLPAVTGPRRRPRGGRTRRRAGTAGGAAVRARDRAGGACAPAQGLRRGRQLSCQRSALAGRAGELRRASRSGAPRSVAAAVVSLRRHAVISAAGSTTARTVGRELDRGDPVGGVRAAQLGALLEAGPPGATSAGSSSLSTVVWPVVCSSGRSTSASRTSSARAAGRSGPDGGGRARGRQDRVQVGRARRRRRAGTAR